MCIATGHVRFTPNSDRESGLPQIVMSALPPKADIATVGRSFRQIDFEDIDDCESAGCYARGDTGMVWIVAKCSEFNGEPRALRRLNSDRSKSRHRDNRCALLAAILFNRVPELHALSGHLGGLRFGH